MGNIALDNTLLIGKIELERMDSILDRIINKSTNLQQVQKSMLLTALNSNLEHKNIIERNVNGY